MHLAGSRWALLQPPSESWVINMLANRWNTAAIDRPSWVLVVLLATACATPTHNALETRFRDEQVDGATYSVTAAQGRQALVRVLAAQRYPAPVFDSANHVYRTGWACGHAADSCDSLVISMEQSALGGGLRFRITRITATITPEDVAMEQGRAFDVEWALMQRLDHPMAKQVEAEAQLRAKAWLATRSTARAP